ncbi:MAG: T9SS type A sorting domain-containing protein [Bacteroidetes bacterium]|nr:T9SS type A sorting domain-containing protein [Bacteroidota bacterium]
MNRKLLFAIVIGMMTIGQIHAQFKKYLYVDSMYPRSSVSRTNNIQYATNTGVITGSPKLENLKLDLYQPTSNASTSRPLVIFMHTGSYLPRYINGTPTGARDDSATVEYCTQIAQRGYVVASISYRLGWNPFDTTEDGRKSGIINAAYKSVQDLASAIRFFKKSVATGNAYGIDSNKIALGGQGTGSYVVYAFSALTAQSDIRIAKFYDFTKKAWMVQDSLLWGDRFGFRIPGSAGILVVENSKGYTSNAHAGFAFGGAMGDSGWMKPGQIPLTSVHSVKDPFAPYLTDYVLTPPPFNQVVVKVSGGHDVMVRENRLGNNKIYADSSKNWGDVYSKNARTMLSPEKIEGLYPIHGRANSSGPWEWWADSVTLVNWLADPSKHPGDTFSLTQAKIIYSNGIKANPLMSKTRALKYIDTSLGYTMPRIACALGLWNCGADYQVNAVKNLDYSANVTVAPVPSDGRIQIWHNLMNNKIQGIEIFDINGRTQYKYGSQGNSTALNLELKPGVYFMNIEFTSGKAVKKFVIQ